MCVLVVSLSTLNTWSSSQIHFWIFKQARLQTLYTISETWMLFYVALHSEAVYNCSCIELVMLYSTCIEIMNIGIVIFYIEKTRKFNMYNVKVWIYLKVSLAINGLILHTVAIAGKFDRGKISETCTVMAKHVW